MNFPDSPNINEMENEDARKGHDKRTSNRKTKE